jgi:hypothetical protein
MNFEIILEYCICMYIMQICAWRIWRLVFLHRCICIQRDIIGKDTPELDSARTLEILTRISRDGISCLNCSTFCRVVVEQRQAPPVFLTDKASPHVNTTTFSPNMTWDSCRGRMTIKRWETSLIFYSCSGSKKKFNHYFTPKESWSTFSNNFVLQLQYPSLELRTYEWHRW